MRSDEFELSVEVNGSPLEIFMLNGMPNVVPQVGEEFVVKFSNNSDKELLVSLSIDGVEVLGKGWDAIVGPNRDYTFKGFSRDDSRIAAFAFADLAKVLDLSR